MSIFIPPYNRFPSSGKTLVSILCGNWWRLLFATLGEFLIKMQGRKQTVRQWLYGLRSDLQENVQGKHQTTWMVGLLQLT